MPDGQLQVEENHAHTILRYPAPLVCPLPTPFEFLDDEQIRLLPETDVEETLMLNPEGHLLGCCGACSLVYRLQLLSLHNAYTFKMKPFIFATIRLTSYHTPE